MMQLAKLGSWFSAEFRYQVRPDAGVVVERLGGPAGPVQGLDEPGRQRLY
jgi:hypothetical protein